MAKINETLYFETDIKFTIDSYEKSQLSNREIAFKNYLQINILIRVSHSLNTMKECNFSIWMNWTWCDAMTEKSPNVLECKSHFGWRRHYFCCCGANEYLIRIHLFCVFFFILRRCFWFSKCISLVKKIFLNCDKITRNKQKKNSPITHQTRIIYKCIRIVYNRLKCMWHKTLLFFCFYFNKNHSFIHSCGWYMDKDYGKIFFYSSLFLFFN